MPKKVRPIPKGYHAVSPSLTQDDAAQTIEFCKKAFGAKLLMRMQAPSGKIMHAEVLIGDSIVMLNDVMQEPAQPANLFLYVQDVDRTISRALKAGATVLMPPQDMFWGDRYGQVTDPFGHQWSFGTHIKDLTPDQMRAAMKSAFAPQK
jgi:PhnB protein